MMKLNQAIGTPALAKGDAPFVSRFHRYICFANIKNNNNVSFEAKLDTLESQPDG